MNQNSKKVKDVLEERAHLPPNFCLVPFSTVILEPDGSVGICRNHGCNFPIGNIKENSLSEIWNGEKAKSWRREFLTNKIETCKDFIKERRCNLTSHFNSILPHVDLSEKQTTPILKLTANFNGKCNLRCQMCPVWKLPNGFYTEENFWKSARTEIFPYLKDIDMLSGEPFIQEDTFKLINEMSVINPECHWNFTTNIHWDFTDDIAAILTKIKIRNINVSIDSLIPDMYSKIRPPGNLAFVLANLNKLISFRESRRNFQYFDLTFNMTVQKDNWKEVPSVIEFCLNKKLNPHIFTLKVPTEYSMLSFEEEKRKEILEYLFNNVSTGNLKHLHMILNPLIFSLDKIDQAQYFLRLQKQFHK